MKRNTNALVFIPILIVTILSVLVGTRGLRAADPAQNELDAVWQRVQRSGAYRFSADIVQTTSPAATVANAGRQSKQNHLYLEGDADIQAETLHLSLWSQGGSVLDPAAPLEIQVDGETARARTPGGDWEAIDNFTGVFAPGGDFLAYTRAATNVTRHAPEIRTTPLGAVQVTRYTFDIDGHDFTLQMHEQMREQAMQEGLPPQVRLDLPRVYTEMTGHGELWVGEDGLPLRQTFTLHFLDSDYGDSSSAEATVDFSGFTAAPAALGIGPNWFGGNGAMGRAAARVLLNIAVALCGLILLAVVVRQRRSRIVYGAMACSISASMIIVPFLMNQRIYAYSAAQQETRQQQDAQQPGPSVAMALAANEMNPQADPLAGVAARAVAQANAAGSPYFDSICTTAPYGDADGDTIVNLSECLLGTLPHVQDTDQDGLNDNVEVAGGKVSGSSEIWYTNPLQQDSNNDGLADGKEWYVGANGETLPDTDGNGTPDIWDDDNDGDGVRDNLDLSPYLSTKPDVATEAKTFSANNPLALQIDDLAHDKLVKVEFQLAPTNADHLRYTQNILDWPVNDRQGQLQDADGKTFYDVDSTVAPNPNDNGDVRLVPMLEIEISGSTQSLPSQDLLTQFGISVQEVVSGTTWAAYVPLQLVTDSVGDDNVAFYARMYYQLDSGWGDVQNVRMVWAVQMLNDICSAYENNICTAYSAYNELQVIQTYGDDWYLTGLNVTEEHGADVALIYEDPAVTGSASGAPSGYDKPFYMDALYGLLYGLDSSFLAGRCSPTDNAGQCETNSQRDMTVDTIYTRFNHATNGGVSEQERWNLPNVLSVQKTEYASIDVGLMQTTITNSVQLLDTHFTSHWSASDPITPTIMLAHEQSYRGLNMDEALTGDGNLAWSGNGLTVKLPTSGEAAVSLDTMASVKWTPYSYNETDGWTAANINSFYNTLSTQLGAAFSSITDPAQASTQQTMAQVLYMAVYDGDSNVVQIDNQIIPGKGVQLDEPIAISLTAEVGSVLAAAVGTYFTFNDALESIAESFPESVDSDIVLSEYLSQDILSQIDSSDGFATLTFNVILLVTSFTEFLIADVLHDANTPFNKTFNEAVEIATVISDAKSVYSDVKSTIQLAESLSSIDDDLNFSNALVEALSSDSALIDTSRMLGVIGLVISAVVAVGVFLYAVASGKAVSGAALGEAFAATIAAIVVAVTLFVLSLTVIGAILVAIVLLVDAILTLAGVKWTITGEITQALAGLIFHEDLIESFTVNTGSLSLTLDDTAEGVIATNPITYSFPITTEFTKVDNGTGCDEDPGCYSRNQMLYMLSDKGEDEDTIFENGIYPTVWHNHYNTNWFSYVTVAYQQTPPLGINIGIPLTLSNYYDALVENCWWFIIESCAVRDIPGTTSTDLGDAVILDVLPGTLDEFVDIGSWTSGDLAMIARDADGDGLRAVAYGGADVKDQLWDQDGDELSDGYELTAASRPASAGGVDLDVANKDTDADGLHDNVEVRWGTNPGRSDTDGDGLLDEEELPPASTWSIPYAYDPSTGQITDARVWSDPNRSDGDGDGMSDLFEQTQNTLTSSPWADANNPRVYNPNVWNESPVALYVTDDSAEGYVRPGATVVYTTSTANNLSNGQELVGELSLTLPDGVSGSPISKTVDIASGGTDALVSTLTFNGTSSEGYQLSSAMSLTDFDQTRWRWEESTGSAKNGFSGTPMAAAIAPTANWDGPYLVATREQTSDGKEAIGGYVVRSDGSTVKAEEVLLPQSGYTPTDPDVACNDSGACLLLWGASHTDPTNNFITGVRLEKSLSNPSTLTWDASGSISNISVASDGTDFMVAWVQGGADVKVAKIPATSGAQPPKGVATISGSNVAAAIEWTGENYTILWTGDGNIHQAEVSTDGAASSASILGAGSGWLQSDGTVHPPALAYDDISGQTLVAYRSSFGELAARRVVNGAGDEFILTDSGVDGDNVTVALSADSKNSGWVVAWTPTSAGEVEYRAISPQGLLRGDIGLLDQSTVTALALTCLPPRPLLKLAFNEAQGDTTFVDSSGNNRTVTCSGTCPEAGVSGRSGSAALFNGANASLAVAKGMALNSFTVAAWLKRGETGRFQSIAATAGPILRFYFNADDTLGCDFGSDAGPNLVTTKDVYVDELWHHYACTFNANNKRITLYRDGVSVASATTADNFSGDNTFYIGRGSIANADDNFNGEMDDFLVVNRAMTAAELTDVFDDAIAVFDLDEPDGAARFVNAVPGGLDGNCSGDSCPTMGVEGVAFTAAQFNGQQSIEIVGSESNAIKTYAWNFEDGKTTDWTYSTGGAPPIKEADRNAETTKFVSFEPDGSRELELSLTDLPSHDTITLSYDIYVLGSDWRGSRTDLTGSDSFYQVSADGTMVMATDFSNAAASTVGEYQLYPAITTPDEEFTFTGIRYYEDGTSRYSGCSGENEGTIGDLETLDRQFELNDKVSCVSISTDTVARLFDNTNYGGSSWLIDVGRSQRPEYANDGVSSMRVWPAAYYPKHGSTDESLTVGSIGNADTAIYRVVQTISHSQSSLKLAFKGAHQLGLDNVSVAVADGGTNILLKNSSFTLSAWGKLDPGGGGYLISQGPGQDNEGLRFGVTDTGAYCDFWGNDLIVKVTTNSDWHHWVCTYDATNKLRTLYRDGVQIGQNTASSNYVGEGPTYLGSGFSGAIDEVGIWTIPLTANEVQELYEKVKIEDESVLVCQLPLTQSDAKVDFGVLTLRETTTRLGDVNQTLNRTITIDADNPTASIASGFFSSNAPGPYVSSPGSLIIAGAANDPTSFVREVRVKPSGGDWQAAIGTESWSYGWETSGLSDGPQTLDVEATDVVGNTGSPSVWHTTLDTTPPTVSIASPTAPVRPTRNESGRWLVPLSGTVSDPAAGSLPGSGVASVEVLLQGDGQVTGLGWQPATLSGSDGWSIDYVMPVFGASGQRVPDPTGVYTATVRATDAVTNTTPAADYPAISMLVDADGPAVTASTALSSTTVISRAMQVGGSVIASDTVQSVEINLVPGAQMGALNGNILHLPMDENLASEYFDDQSGTNHDATCRGATCPTVGQPGQRDLAFQFDGIDDTLAVADIDLANASFTLSAWAKRDVNGVGLRILSQGKGADYMGLVFGFRSTNTFTCGFYSDELNTNQQYSETGWHHWACTYDAESKTRTIYRDGERVAHDTTLDNYQGSGSFYIGSQWGKSDFFGGLIDEVVVYDRTLAAYEVANLYAYGESAWQSATLDSNSWSYQIPDGDSGIEGLFQLNVRGTDAVGNVTPQGGQRVWRGEIDTKSPTITAPVTITTIGGLTTTIFDCDATDFSLDDSTSCIADWDPPKWRESDRTFTNYGEVNPWYGATFTETQRLYAIDATRIYTTETPVPDVNVTACDLYGHCTTVPSDVHRESVDALSVTPLAPLPGDVLTALEPIQVTGRTLAPQGAAALVVKVDGSTLYRKTWLDDTPVDEAWSFRWTPPGSGVYTIQPILYDWETYAANFAKDAATEGASAQRNESPPEVEQKAPTIALPLAAYFPLTFGRGGRLDARGEDGLYRTYLPFAATVIQEVDGIPGPASVIYVDLEPPTLTISPTLLTAAQKRGRHGALLAGTVSDDAQLYAVEVRVDGSPWRAATILHNEQRWRLVWGFDRIRDGETVEVTARVTDVAGRTTTITEAVQIATAAPGPGDVALFFLDAAGQHQPVPINATHVAAASIGVAWDAAQSRGPVTYQVGFSQQLPIDPSKLTNYTAPGTHTRAVQPGERWYATVRYVDAVGNARTVLLGPLTIRAGQ